MIRKRENIENWIRITRNRKKFGINQQKSSETDQKPIISWTCIKVQASSRKNRETCVKFSSEGVHKKVSHSMREAVDFMQPKEGLLPTAKQQQQKTQENPSRKVSLNESAILCCICFDKVPDSVFMDCGHGGVCYDCSLDIWKTTEECYLCRAVWFCCVE